MKSKGSILKCVLGMVAMIAVAAPGLVQAQVPPLVEAELVKMGRVVDPGCTGKLYRTLFGKNDYNTYWPVDAAEPNKNIKLYPGVTLMRDVSYGPQPKDLIYVFVGDKGGANRTVFIYVPGGAGNKIEQQSVESNMFYDNVGKWATDNGMIGVTIQRGGTAAGQNIALVIEWLQNNIAKYKGNPNDMFILAHSAGTAPLAQYIGRPDLYGVGVKGAIFMGANPNIGLPGGGRGGPGGAAGGAGGGGRGGAPAAAAAPAAATATCLANANTQAGPIRGPSSSLPDMGAGAAAARMALAGASPWKWDGKMWISTGAAAPPAAAPAAGAPGGGRGGGAPGGAPGGGAGGRGGAGGGAPGGAPGAAGGGRGGPAQGAPAAAGAAPAPPTFTVLDGFRSTRAAIGLAWGEWDIDATAGAGMPTGSVAIHDELCKLDGPKPKDGVGHCPTMMWFKGESHMSEVFSFGSIDKIVSDQVSAFIKSHH